MSCTPHSPSYAGTNLTLPSTGMDSPLCLSPSPGARGVSTEVDVNGMGDGLSLEYAAETFEYLRSAEVCAFNMHVFPQQPITTPHHPPRCTYAQQQAT